MLFFKIFVVVLVVFPNRCKSDRISGTSEVTIQNLGKVKGNIMISEDLPCPPGPPIPPDPPVPPPLRLPDPCVYYEYFSMPYAQHTERFHVAKAVLPWNDTHDGTVEGPICPQPLGDVEYPGAQSEQCLVLSVATKQDPNHIGELKPVLVFIHGGIFTLGCARKTYYDPALMAMEDLVVVNVNYRLGPLGWVTDGEIIPRNLGLKDVRLALEWVHSYITSFGGDPSKVTIDGESAGSTIVSALSISSKPSVAKLFRSGVMQSGVIITPFAIQKHPEKAFEQVLGRTKCSVALNQTREEQVKCLRELDYNEMHVASVNDAFVVDIIDLGLLDGLITAIVEEDPSDPDAVVTYKPLEQLTKGQFRKDVAMMISTTSEEFLTFSALVIKLRSFLNKEIVPYGMMAEDPDMVGGLIKNQYGGSEVKWSVAPVPVLTRFASDIAFNFPLRRYIEILHPNMPTTPIYVMKFSYASKMAKFNDLGSLVGHSDDLFYNWKIELMSRESTLKLTYPPETFTKRRQLCKMLGNFVKHQNPTPEKDALLTNITWSRVSDPKTVEHLNFAQELTMRTKPMNDANYKFLSDLYEKYGRGEVSL